MLTDGTNVALGVREISRSEVFTNMPGLRQPGCEPRFFKGGLTLLVCLLSKTCDRDCRDQKPYSPEALMHARTIDKAEVS